ncbi:MAG: ribosome recycling factor [Clostridia bacterium]|nr:ribosome recycling factor [Clostridia bacterium]
MEVINDCESKMKNAVNRLEEELSTIRAGRANPAILDRVMVLYYGVPTPLKQVANVVVPEARMLEVKPWDKSSLKDIEKAIIDANLNLTPNNDGNVIRLQFPELTEERRKDLVKDVKKVVEDFKVNVRNCRRDAMDEIKKQEKDKVITEDDVKAFEKDIQDVTDKYIALIDKVSDNKQQEIMTV